MNKFLTLVLIGLISLSSCSEYQKVLKSKDNELKYEKAKEYYNNGKYAKAISLLEGLINVYRGTDKAEEIFYLYTYCHYNQRDYILAGYYFKNFAQTYRNSKYTEECTFMSAYCSYLDSPKPELDQKETREALQSFELFLSKYPDTERKEEVQKLMKELITKLEKKTLMAAEQYYTLHQYEAAIVTIKSALKDAPNSAFKEELMFLDIESKYEYAVNSIAEKQAERYEDVVKSYYSFSDAFPDSKQLKDASRYFERSNDEIAKLKKEQI